MESECYIIDILKDRVDRFVCIFGVLLDKVFDKVKKMFEDVVR